LITEDIKANTPVGTSDVILRFPEGVYPFSLSAQVIDGKLESVWWETGGLEVQDEALAELIKKYGKPTRFHEDRKQNAFGAQFVSHRAEWHFVNLTVTFSGSLNTIDVGAVTISTNKMQEYQKTLGADEPKGLKL
jgi:hypothetical protein